MARKPYSTWSSLVGFTSRRTHANRSRRRNQFGAEPLERREMLAGLPLAPGVLPAGAPGDSQLPDMLPWADESQGYMYGSYIDTSSEPGQRLLRFSTAVANVGTGPMELRGGAVLPSGDQEVFQRISLEGGGFEDRLAGTFVYHADHGHIHFDGYATYNLRERLAEDGVGEIVATGGKVSFCLLDVEQYSPSAGPEHYSSCGQVQGISVGWADVYNASLPDQWIDVTDVPEGDYWLEVVVDPDDRLAESDETNNSALVPVTLGNSTVVGDRFEDNDDEFTPTDFGALGDRTETDLSIDSPDDDDYYRFSAVADGVVTIDVLFQHSAGDIDIELLSDTFDILDSSSDTADSEQVSAAVTAGATYLLRVYGYSGAINGQYEFTIDAPGNTSGDRFEPNDDLSHAADLGAFDNHTEANLSIHAAANDDYFQFQPMLTGPVSVSISFMNAAGDLHLDVYDASGTQLDTSATTNDHEMVTFAGQAGATYVVRVWGFDGATNANYDLSIDSPDNVGDVTGVVWNDRDGDGVRDAFEAGLAHRIVYVDANGNGQFDSAPPAAKTFSSTNVPLAILDGSTVTSMITISGQSRPIESVSVNLSLTHSYLSDLDVFLISPSGTRVELFTDVGDDGADMTNLTLTDTAATPIGQGAAPFTGAFRPERPLSVLAGELADGDWKLEITDDAEADEGALVEWSLRVMTEGYFEPTAETDADGVYRLAGLAPGTHAIGEVLPPDWILTQPRPSAFHSVAVAAGESTANTDFGNQSSTATSPRVIDVRVGRLGGAMFSIPSGGGAQLAPLPLVGLNQVGVVFDGAWNVEEHSFHLDGVNHAEYLVGAAGFSVTAGTDDTLIATWTLVEPIDADSLALTIAADGELGTSLDGEWTNPSNPSSVDGSSFPSGDGRPGGDFRFRFQVLPGDVDQDGVVGRADLAALLHGAFVDQSMAAYRPLNDLDGDGTVGLADFMAFQGHFGVSLPKSEPGGSPTPAGSVVLAARSSRESIHAGAPRPSIAATRALRRLAVDAVFETSAPSPVDSVSGNSLRVNRSRPTRV